MVIINKLCNSLTCSIKSKFSDVDEEKCEVINYGLYLFFADISKMLITLTLATFLGVLKYIVFSMIFFGIIRTFSGGSHANSWLRCLIINNGILFSMVYLSILLSNTNSKLLTTFVFLICFLIFYKLVPSDHENKPIVSIKQKRKLRIITFCLFFSYYLLSSFIFTGSYSNIINFSIIAVSLGMLPITYNISGSRHSTD